MKPRKSIIGRSVVFVTFAIVATVIVIVIYMTKPVTSLKSAGVQASRLIASVGGPAKVCNEANQIFKRFGVSKEKFFSPSELQSYPAIAALGTAHVILPNSPPYISIRVGTHRDGFFIDIADTNSPGKYPRSTNAIELVHSCVFVHR